MLGPLQIPVWSQDQKFSYALVQPQTLCRWVGAVQAVLRLLPQVWCLLVLDYAWFIIYLIIDP